MHYHVIEMGCITQWKWYDARTHLTLFTSYQHHVQPFIMGYGSSSWSCTVYVIIHLISLALSCIAYLVCHLTSSIISYPQHKWHPTALCTASQHPMQLQTWVRLSKS